MSEPSHSLDSKIASAPEDTAAKFETRIVATPFDAQPRVLKHGDTFGVFDRYGDINPLGQKGEAGIYHEGTRYLSRLLLTLDGAITLLLNSAVDDENVVLTVDLTNSASGPTDAPQGALHIRRSRLLHHGSCVETIDITNFARRPMAAVLSLHVGADFADVFEVRGVERERRGESPSVIAQADGIVLPYLGLDGVERRTEIRTSPPPDRIEGTRLDFLLHLEHQQCTSICLRISCRSGEPLEQHADFNAARDKVSNQLNAIGESACRIKTSNDQFNTWLSRSQADLLMMITRTPHGLYPYAGVPWYSTVFGRDGIITALQCLWMMPEVARGVLAFLAAYQADRIDEERDCEPGKILHEMRSGEMAALNEIPFGLYFGSVDSTPFFVYLAAEYFQRTADYEFIRRLWPHVERALDWMTDHGDVDDDGFLEYRRRSPDGLVHQGWKDSHDAIFHADGSEPAPPIALCEVQANAYGAYLGAARMALALGDQRRSDELRARADRLRTAFQAAFWLDDLGTFALALDGDKKPCKVRTSNTGQCLLFGIAERWQAERIARTLLDGHHYSGWGIRTLDDREARYNPISYHNGSVWPHDNALIALGFARYGLLDECSRVLSDLYGAALFMDLNRLPELFCGFGRRRSQGPTLYPVACAPQAWAAAGAFGFMQACMALRIDALENRVEFAASRMPPMLNHINLTNLRVGKTTMDLRLHRFDGDVGLHVIRKDGDAEIAILK